MPVIDSLRNLVRKAMKASTTNDWEHVERVFNHATIIAESENADVELCQVGALLHDIGRVVGEPHNLTGRGRAKVILRGQGYPENRINKVLRIIEVHTMSEWENLKTLEERIIWDADKLDGLGAIGLARVFHMRGENDMRFHDFSWFKEDTVLRYERLNTDTAKGLGKKRIEYMKRFFETLGEEINQGKTG